MYPIRNARYKQAVNQGPLAFMHLRVGERRTSLDCVRVVCKAAAVLSNCSEGTSCSSAICPVCCSAAVKPSSLPEAVRVAATSNLYFSWGAVASRNTSNASMAGASIAEKVLRRSIRLELDRQQIVYAGARRQIAGMKYNASPFSAAKENYVKHIFAAA